MSEVLVLNLNPLQKQRGLQRTLTMAKMQMTVHGKHSMCLMSMRGRICWLPAFSPSSSLVIHYFDMALACRSLTHYHTIPHFEALEIYRSGKHCEKKRNCF